MECDETQHKLVLWKELICHSERFINLLQKTQDSVICTVIVRIQIAWIIISFSYSLKVLISYGLAVSSSAQPYSKSLF